METFDGTADQVRATGRRLHNDLSDGSHKITNAASAEIQSLIADVEDLVSRIADLKDADDYVHDSPWQAIGIAALVGALVGIVATRRS